ncbi:MAG TPA: substrate-binding domain-containing protein [Solirubrobacteraceae bacterium]|jgi:simple sugar transport system substrate-binding protein|nr:substrate-binding domain-containing protein [Solirubrobacteraceae bacterium]
MSVIRRRFGVVAILGSAAALALASVGGGAANAKSSSAHASVSGKKVTFIIYSTPSTAFFLPVVNGANAAAKLFGLKLNVEYSNSDVPTENNQIESAVASGTNGIAVSVPDNNAYTKAICAAHSDHIPIVTFNVTATAGKVLDCTMSFVGQDFVSAGYQIAEKLITAGKLKHGAQVFCPVEQETAVYAVQRAQGANEALKTIGSKCNVVSTGFDLGQAQTEMQQYLIGHSKTAAILGLGQVPLQVGPAAAKAAGLKNLPIAGFDMSSQIATNIKRGKTIATIEQQPYEQGFYSVEQLALYLEYGLQPSNVNTGDAIVDKSNISQVAALTGKVY